MKKNKKTIKKLIAIKENTFGTTLNLFIGHTFNELNNKLKQCGFGELEEDNKNSLGTSFILYKEYSSNPYHTIWLPIKDWTLKTQAVLAHELIHFILSATNKKGIKIINKPNYDNETFAYLYEYFFYESSCKIDDLFRGKTKKTIK